jgi:hypothetical protein
MQTDPASAFPHGSARLLFHLSEAEGGMACSIPVCKGVAGHCATTNAVVNIDDAWADPRFETSVDRQTGQTTRVSSKDPDPTRSHRSHSIRARPDPSLALNPGLR